MRLTKERKIYAMLVGVAATGLAAVLMTSGPGAAVTQAAAAAVDVDNTAAPKTAAGEAEPSTGLISLASKLKSFQTSHPLGKSIDAFKPGAAWAPPKQETESAVATQAADAFQAAHQLSAVLVAGHNSRAIVDGRTFAIGQTLLGYKLVAVTPKTAVFQASGRSAILRVPAPEQIAAIDSQS